MQDVVIVAARRTAVGSFGGSLAGIPASDLGALVIKDIMASTGVAPAQIDEVLLGQVLSDAGRKAEAAERYLDGLAVAEANDFRLLQGELLARLGEVESDRSTRMNYLQRSLTVFRELGAVDRMRDVQTAVHRAIMGH